MYKSLKDEVQCKITKLYANAPNNFPYRDYLKVQDTLESVYDELRDAFERYVKKHGDNERMQLCRKWIEESYQIYKKGDRIPAIKVLQQVDHEIED